MHQYIVRELLFQEAMARGVAADTKQVETVYDQVRAGFKDEKRFEESLADQGLDPQSYKQELRVQETVNALLAKVGAAITVTDAEAKAFFDAHPRAFDPGEKLEIRHILFKVPAGASERTKEAIRVKAGIAANRAATGADFGKLAQQQSEDPETKARGGLIEIRQGMMPPAFDQAAFALQPGQVSGLVETPVGLSVIKLEKRIPGPPVSFDSVQEAVRAEVLREKRQTAYPVPRELAAGEGPDRDLPLSLPAVEVRDLRKSYGPVEAVRGLSFAIGTGECFGLLGPNGAGKTTTIEILEGLLDPTSGEVSVLGRRWGRDDREIRERIGVCLQQTVLSEKLQVDETLGLFRAFYREGRPTRRRARGGGARREAARAGGHALRRAEAAAGGGLRARRGPRAALPRRAHHRPRPAVAAAALGHRARLQAARPHGAPHHPLHGRGGEALRPGRGRGPRAGDRHGHAARAHAHAGRRPRDRDLGRAERRGGPARLRTSRACPR